MGSPGVSRLALLALLAPAIAHADPDAKTRAKTLFEEGRALAKASRYADACRSFEASFALDAETGTQVNWADCLEHLGKLRDAWEQFDRAADASLRAGNPVRAKFARDRANALEGKLATIDVHVLQPTLPGLEISVGDHAVAVADEIHDLVEPGDVDVVAIAPDHHAQRTPVHAVAGGVFAVEILLEPNHHDTSGAPVASPKPLPMLPIAPLQAEVATPATFERDRGRVHIAYIVGGAGIAIGAGGLGLALYAKDQYDTNAAKRDVVAANRDVQLADIATGFAIASGACVATAAILYFTAPRERVVVSPTGNGVAIAGSF